MTRTFHRPSLSRAVATLLAVCLALPLAALPAQARLLSPMPSVPVQAMSTKKKVVLLAGAALLYYLYRKHQASKKANAQAGKTQQLYRSRNGGVYYRDPQGKPVWLTVPQQGMAVSTDEAQRYAPGYQRYQSQSAPPAPRGYATQSFSQYDSSLIGGMR